MLCAKLGNVSASISPDRIFAGVYPGEEAGSALPVASLIGRFNSLKRRIISLFCRQGNGSPSI
jgi:hypothetical protein